MGTWKSMPTISMSAPSDRYPASGHSFGDFGGSGSACRYRQMNPGDRQEKAPSAISDHSYSRNNPSTPIDDLLSTVDPRDVATQQGLDTRPHPGSEECMRAGRPGAADRSR
ncbi:hypothetical protein GCM10010521_74450 [Streptomyces rameus]|uniref:Uncharacterized protein n=1 Tax=Streptomyces rameus TaxID=68261 RepID=A0ABP6HRD3_9ACTN